MAVATVTVTDTNCNKTAEIKILNNEGDWGSEVQDCISGFGGDDPKYSAVVGDTMYIVRLQGGGGSATNAYFEASSCQGDEVGTPGSCNYACNSWLDTYEGYYKAYYSLGFTPTGCIRARSGCYGGGSYYCLREHPYGRSWSESCQTWQVRGLNTSRMTRQTWTCN